MTTEITPAKVRLSDQLGHASEAQPLVDRLRARLAGSICNADGTYTVGNCPPDALSQEAADEIERLQEREAFILSVTRDAQQIAGACGAEIERLREAGEALVDAYRNRYARPSTDGIRADAPLRHEIAIFNEALKA